MPAAQATITISIDPDVLLWFKRQGKGYESKMNAALRLYAKAHQAPALTNRQKKS